MSAAKERIEEQERSCHNESFCVGLRPYSHLTSSYWHLNSSQKNESEASEALLRFPI